MAIKQLVQQNAFKFTWKNNPEKSTPTANDYLEMRDWQVKAFEYLKNSWINWSDWLGYD